MRTLSIGLSMIVILLVASLVFVPGYSSTYAQSEQTPTPTQNPGDSFSISEELDDFPEAVAALERIVEIRNGDMALDFSTIFFRLNDNTLEMIYQGDEQITLIAAWDSEGGTWDVLVDDVEIERTETRTVETEVTFFRLTIGPNGANVRFGTSTNADISYFAEAGTVFEYTETTTENGYVWALLDGDERVAIVDSQTNGDNYNAGSVEEGSRTNRSTETVTVVSTSGGDRVVGGGEGDGGQQTVEGESDGDTSLVEFEPGEEEVPAGPDDEEISSTFVWNMEQPMTEIRPELMDLLTRYRSEENTFSATWIRSTNMIVVFRNIDLTDRVNDQWGVEAVQFVPTNEAVNLVQQEVIPLMIRQAREDDDNSVTYGILPAPGQEPDYSRSGFTSEIFNTNNSRPIVVEVVPTAQYGIDTMWGDRTRENESQDFTYDFYGIKFARFIEEGTGNIVLRIYIDDFDQSSPQISQLVFMGMLFLTSDEDVEGVQLGLIFDDRLGMLAFDRSINTNITSDFDYIP